MHLYPQIRVKIVTVFVLFLSLILGLSLKFTDPSSAQDIQPQYTKPLLAVGEYGFLDTEKGVPDAIPFEEEIAAPASVTAAIDWHYLVYQAYINNNWEIVLSNANGSNPLNLTQHSAPDARPALNPAATTIVFNSGRDGDSEIYTMDTIGGSLTQLTVNTASDFGANWSPNGSLLVFVSNRSGNYEIYTMNSDGAIQTKLTANGQDNGAPSWSPDGLKIVWRKCISDTNCSIWIMNADGSGSQALTSAIPYLGTPVFSPDGNSIGFDGDVDGDSWNEVAVLTLSTKEIKALVDPAYSNDYFMNDWSADGGWILYTKIVYTIQNNQLYIQSSALMRYSLTGPIVGIPSPYLIPMGGNWQLADRLPPSTNVVPLPDLGPANGFLVSWSGIDPGPSGIETFDVQYIVDETDPWMNWLSDTSNQSGVFQGQADHTYTFRVRARDRAGNLGGWNTNLPGQTRVYTFQLSGVITDNRGNPFPFSMPDVNPAPILSPVSNWNGRYQIYLQAAGIHSLNFQKMGYQPLLNLNLDINADTNRNDYLAPQNNILQNGGFENNGTLSGWQYISLDAKAEITTESHTGSQAARLGNGCLEPCLGAPEKLSKFGYGATMAYDKQGVLHFLYFNEKDNLGITKYGLYYRQRSPAGIWSAESYIAPVSNDFETGIDMVIAPDGKLMVTFSYYVSGWYHLFYIERSPDGIWSPAEAIGEGGGYPHMALDPQGTLHMTYQYHSGISTYYLTRSFGGVWSTPVHFTISTGLTSAIAVDAFGTIHMLIPGGGYLGTQVYYYQISPSGVWSQPVLVTPPGYSISQRSVSLAVEPNGRLHAFMSGIYSTRDLIGNWSPAENFGVGYTRGDITVDKQGVVYFFMDNNATNKAAYIVRGADGKLLLNQTFPNYSVMADENKGEILIDPQGNTNLALCGSIGDISQWGVYFFGAPKASYSGNASVSQQVIIPSEMNSPTLSFEYSLKPDANPNNPVLHVNVVEIITDTQQVQTTEVFTAATTRGWEMGWADLSRWTGKNITVTFSLTQFQGQIQQLLLLDDVSLGSWLTPVIQKVNPAILNLNFTQVITISAQNIFSGTVMEAGNDAFGQVTMLDSHTLKVILPPVNSPGLREIWLRNPGGQRSLLPYILIFGKPFFLPIINR